MVACGQFVWRLYALESTVVKRVVWLSVWAVGLWLALVAEGFAATCGPATSPGTAPPSWQTYCWIDMTSYSSALVFGAGQSFSITLSDGSTFNFLLSGTSSPASSGLTAIAPPSWSGAAVGNTAFLGIPKAHPLHHGRGHDHLDDERHQHHAACRWRQRRAVQGCHCRCRIDQ